MKDQSDEWVSVGIDDWVSDGAGARYRNRNDEHVCPECRAMEDVIYFPHDIPVPPYEKCTSPDGCRCWMTAVVLVGYDDDELSSFKWATPDTRGKILKVEEDAQEEYLEGEQVLRRTWYRRLFR